MRPYRIGREVEKEEQLRELPQPEPDEMRHGLGVLHAHVHVNQLNDAHGKLTGEEGHGHHADDHRVQAFLLEAFVGEKGVRLLIVLAERERAVETVGFVVDLRLLLILADRHQANGTMTR